MAQPKKQNHKWRTQTRTSLSQRCLPTGPASAANSSSLHHSPGKLFGNGGNAGDMPLQSSANDTIRNDYLVSPDWGAQFGDRQVGGASHNTREVNHSKGNRGTHPQSHLITEKAFYTEYQPRFAQGIPGGGIPDITTPGFQDTAPPIQNLLSATEDELSVQKTYLRVDLTQGGTAFRANCVIVRGTMQVVNQPIAGTGGRFGITSNTIPPAPPGVGVFTANEGFQASSTSIVNNFIFPTIDFEHVFLCQPLASNTDYRAYNGLSSLSQYVAHHSLISGTFDNTFPSGSAGQTHPGWAPSNSFIPTSSTDPYYNPEMYDLGRLSTKSNNYIEFRNSSIGYPFSQNHPYLNENESGVNNTAFFSPGSNNLPIASVLNTPTHNYAMFSNRNSAQFTSAGQPLNQRNNTDGDAANDMSWASGQLLGDGTFQENGTFTYPDGFPHYAGNPSFRNGVNLNWVDFKFRFRTVFPQLLMSSDSMQAFYTNLPAHKRLNFAPRVVIKGTYLLI